MTPIDPDAVARGLEAVAAYPAVNGAVNAVKSTIIDPVAEELKKPIGDWAREKLVPSVRRILRLEDAARQAAEDAAAVLTAEAPKRLIEPAPEVFASVVEAYQTRVEFPELRAMFARLLASAMTEEGRGLAHPSFAEIIRQMTGEEARIFRAVVADGPYYHVHYRSDRDLTPDERSGQLRTAWEIVAEAAGLSGEGVSVRVAYALSNLTRLGLVQNVETTGEEDGMQIRTGRAVMSTEFGRLFAHVCLGVAAPPLPVDWTWGGGE